MKERSKKRKQRMSQYPTHWLTLVTRIANGKEVLIQFPTRDEASNLRFRYFHFRDALGVEAKTNPVYETMFRDAELIIARLIPVNPCLAPSTCTKKKKDICESCKGPTKLLFQNRDLVSEGAILSKALAEPEEPDTTRLLNSLVGGTPNV